MGEEENFADEKGMTREITGLGIGNVIAAILSWTANHSIGWCIVHTLLGWFYVLYRLIV